jgi:hypothetical protein
LIVPLRGGPGLADAVKITVPLPLPVAPEMIWIQASTATAVQDEVAVTLMEPPPLVAATGCPGAVRVQVPEQAEGLVPPPPPLEAATPEPVRFTMTEGCTESLVAMVRLPGAAPTAVGLKRMVTVWFTYGPSVSGGAASVAPNGPLKVNLVTDSPR